MPCLSISVWVNGVFILCVCVVWEKVLALSRLLTQGSPSWPCVVKKEWMYMWSREWLPLTSRGSVKPWWHESRKMFLLVGEVKLREIQKINIIVFTDTHFLCVCCFYFLFGKTIGIYGGLVLECCMVLFYWDHKLQILV